MTDSLFSDSSTQTNTETSSVDVVATKLFNIKNEKGEPKYDSLEKAIGALEASQVFIPQLKDENERLKQELEAYKADLAKRDTVEDVISRFTTSRQSQEPPHTSDVPKGLDEAAVQEMLQRTLTEREKAAVASQNVSAVRNALVSKFGDKAQEVVAAKASELGLTMDALSSLSASSPQAVLSWFQASTPTSSGAPVRSSVNLPDAKPKEGITPPSKSLVRGGASSKDLMEYMAQIRKQVYKEHDITE
ncbi:MAG: hypothetical protein [Bacteriophage sp.]|nr:MAG: hypothetical protein [Bacteriophage sp.]